MQSHYLFICSLILLTNYGDSKSEIGRNYRFPITLPEGFDVGFSGKAFLMETSHVAEPKFRVALTVDVADYRGVKRYSCSLQIFLGDVRVWNSGHYSSFFVSDTCEIEFTGDGDLRLKGKRGRVGWRTGTSGQGAEKLQILNTGNLVLIDASNNIKWQSFNFPTDVMLWGQRLNVATRLTSFPTNSTSYYSFEIQSNRVALCLNSPESTYPYWEFKPSNNRNLSFIKLASSTLHVYDQTGKKIAQISPPRSPNPLRFLGISNRTGNIGLFRYIPSASRFQAAFHALNATCDLPLACGSHGVCTRSGACLHALEKPSGEGFCGNVASEMVELDDVASVLMSAKRVGVSKEACVKECLDDCRCEGAAFGHGVCELYGLVGGLKEVERGSGVGFTVKVRKSGGGGRSNVKKWVLILVGVVDGLVIMGVLGGAIWYFLRKRKRNSET